MKQLQSLIVRGIIVILLFDTVSALAARVLEFPYTDLAIVSSLIYTTFGFLAAKRVNISAGAAVGAILGLTDATIGWAISWSIGPGYVPEAAGRPLVIAAIILYVIAIAAGCAFVGAITAKIWARLATP